MATWLVRQAVLCAVAGASSGLLFGQSVKISPGYTSVGVGGTVQYTATVTGLANPSVVWLVSSVVGGNSVNGTITTGGLYTAPATIPSNGITILARASDGHTMDVVYVNVAPPGPPITAIQPNPVKVGTYTVTVKGSGYQNGAVVSANGISLSTTFVDSSTLTAVGWQGSAGSVPFSVRNASSFYGPPFMATFTKGGSTPQTIAPTAVNLSLGATQQFTSPGAASWSATAGSVTTTGLFTAPSTMPASGHATVTATGPNGSASATITLIATPMQTISPTSVTLNLGATQQFTSSGATSWTATAGSVTGTGLFTAPSTMPASGRATVTAIGSNGSASATVTLTAPVQTISPTSVTLNLGATQQFTSPGATSWSTSAGTVTTAGLYTAPTVMPASGQATVTATGPNGSANALVTIAPPVPTITGVGNGHLPLGVFTATITGTGFTAQSVARLSGATMSSSFSNGSLTVTGFAGQTGQANITVANGASVSAPFLVQVGVANPLVTASAARRFLEQAAFGPSPSDADHVQSIGFSAWIDEQFAMPQISSYAGITSSQGGMPNRFLAMAVTNSDQLRQRVAFAFSQIFVTSTEKVIWNDTMVPYENMLLADAFVNYRQIMGDVTLSPAMGQYLDMANNGKADPLTGSLANENYARELMQLFTIGTNLLNQDGTLQYDANQLPIPTYSQFTVTEFARVYTGWTYAPAPGQTPNWNAYQTSYGPMVPYPSEHDSGSKQLLRGYVAAAGLSAQDDLTGALDNIFQHPNVPPFVARQLIQHLVKSNPSPAYISRVAAAFSGSGVRGDMKAMLKAILLDPEARANDQGSADQASDGHLQEPALFLTAMVRAFGGAMTEQNYYPQETAAMGQDLFASPSVFNYYSTSYRVPGTALMGGEFQIHTPNNAIVRANEVSSLFGQYSNPVQSYGPGTTIDLTPLVALAANPATLVDALDLTLTHGTMPAAMKTAVVNAATGETGGSLRRVQTACYLILTSNYYNVWH